MARRADHTREELKELAITAGKELLKKEGFSQFSARKVASHIGYTIGTLYNVFGSYDNLILHINARTLDEWFIFMETAMKKKTQKNQLHTLAQAYIEYSRKHYRQWLALFEYHVEDALPSWYMEKMGRFFTLTESTLFPLVQNNRPKAKRVARVLWAGIHGICILSLSGKLDLVESDSPETLAISFLDHYMAGIAQNS